MESQKPMLLAVMPDLGLLAFDYRRSDHQDEVLDMSIMIMHLPSLVACNLEVEASEELGRLNLSSI